MFPVAFGMSPIVHFHLACLPMSLQLKVSLPIIPSWIPVGTTLTCKQSAESRRKRSQQLTTPVSLIHFVLLIDAFLIRTVMPLVHILVVRSHLVTVSVLFRRIMLVNLWLWPASLSSTCSSTPTRTGLTTGVTLLRIVTFTSLFGRSSSCALTD